jgi:putative tricarboxylic transport membrane protein
MSAGGPAERRPPALHGEAAFTLVLIALAACMIWQSTLVTEPPSNTVVGPRVFPLVIGWSMLAVALLIGWQNMRARLGRAAASAFVPQEDEDTAISDWRGVWAVLASLLLLCVLLEPLGFVTSIAVFLFGLSTFFAPRRWRVNAATALPFAVFFYWLFTRVLEIPLPNGILSAFF